MSPSPLTRLHRLLGRARDDQKRNPRADGMTPVLTGLLHPVRLVSPVGTAYSVSDIVASRSDP